jgi:hypothetical protein
MTWTQLHHFWTWHLMAVSVQLHVHATLFRGKETPVSIGWNAVRVPQSVWEMWRREKSLSPAGNRTPAVQRVSIPTELSRLLFRMRSLLLSVILAKGQVTKLAMNFQKQVRSYFFNYRPKGYTALTDMESWTWMVKRSRRTWLYKSAPGHTSILNLATRHYITSSQLKTDQLSHNLIIITRYLCTLWCK